MDAHIVQNTPHEPYNLHSMHRSTEELIKAANSSTENDTSLNSAKRSFLTEEEARGFFESARQSLLDIKVWDQCGKASNYVLFDENGTELSNSEIKEGLFIRIHLKATGKFDWVRVTNIHREQNELVITVKPAHDPTQQSPDVSVISHFFDESATNNFCLQSDGRSVSIYVIGIGEKQNTANADGLIETARNVATANLGYYLGIQKAEWKSFCTTFLEIAGTN